MNTMTTTTKPRVTSEENAWLIKCVQRAVNEHGGDAKRVTLDLATVHAECCTLDFEKLAESSDSDFVQDLAGIEENLDRDNSILSYRPLCAASAWSRRRVPCRAVRRTRLAGSSPRAASG